MKSTLFYIAGKKGAGKSTLINLFSKEGFYTTELRFNLEEALTAGMIDPKSIPVPFYWTYEMLEFTFRKIRNKSLVVLTGLYNTKDIQHFNELGFKVVIISIIAKDDIRHERIIKRESEKGNYVNINDLVYKDSKRDGRAAGFEFNNIDQLIALSEYQIENNGELRDFHKSFYELLLSLRVDFPHI